MVIYLVMPYSIAEMNDLGDFISNVGVIVGLLAYAIKYVRDKRKARRRRSTLDESLEFDARIYPIIWELQAKYKAMRVYIVQFHNGANFYTGQSIQKMTISHEVPQYQAGIGRMKNFYDNVLVSELDHRMLIDMKKGGYFVCSDRYRVNDDAAMRQWMDTYGMLSAYQFRIQDKKTGETVATLNLHFDRPEGLEPINIAHIMEIRKLLESIFDEL